MNIKFKFEDNIILDTPFNKITNKSHVLFYINAILKKIQTMEQNDQDKAEMIGIIQMHISECPFGDCPTKKKDRIYLPLIEEWTIRNILEINDKIFLMNFITFIFNFYISQNYMSPDLYMNLALYYLQVIGNNYLSAFYFNKVSDFKLSDQENFSFFRLHRVIQRELIEKLKPTNEACYQMQDLNTTMYFKYDDLGQKFFDEITSDCNTNLEFWKIFKGYKEQNAKLDFNKIFSLTDKIRISKNKIEKYWEQLFAIYNGFNDMFDLYENYVGYINDDGVLCRELELIKNKILLSGENLNSNFTSVLFSKETGILIANGDKGKEGLIEHVNTQIESIFNYRSEELKGININRLMPKIFSQVHHVFMEQYNNIGEKRVINKTFDSYGKDRNNSLIPLVLRTKSFPILSDYIFYISLITKQSIDDVILLDRNFNIQGMSQRLMEKFSLNENIFQDCDIPFYFICKKFIRHYKKNTPKEKKRDYKFKNFPKLEKEMKDISNFSNSNNNNNNTSNLINFSNLNNNKLDDKNNEVFFTLETYENADLEFDIRIPPIMLCYTSNYSSREHQGFIRDEAAYDESDVDLDVIQEEEDNRVEESFNSDSEENNDFLVDESNNTNNNNSNFPIIQSINNLNLGNKNNNRRHSVNYSSSLAALNNNNKNNSRNKNIPSSLNNFNSNNINNNPNIKNFQNPQIQNVNPIFDIEHMNSRKNGTTNYEEQDLQYKINYFRSLFEKRAFESLESEVDGLNQDSVFEEYKFIFTFENYEFGSDKANGYVVRCIERQFEDILSYSDGSRQKELLKTSPLLRQNTSHHLFQNKHSKSSSLYKHMRQFIEYTKDEYNSHFSNQAATLKKYFEELIENKLINEFREELLKNSKIFFMLTGEQIKNQDDQASSHQSVVSNQDEFSKKSRIMEIRSNLNKDIDKFYTLRSIKMIFVIMVVLAAIFSFVFIIKFSEILNSLLNIHSFSNLLTRAILTFSEITANMISLNSIFLMHLGKNDYFSKASLKSSSSGGGGSISSSLVYSWNKFNLTQLDDKDFYSFIPDKNSYFDFLKNESKLKFTNLTNYISQIESLMEDYLTDSTDDLYWNEVENIHLYSYKVINGIPNRNSYNLINNGRNYLTSSLGISILEILTNQNKILKSTFFTISNFLQTILESNKSIPSNNNNNNNLTSDFKNQNLINNNSSKASGNSTPETNISLNLTENDLNNLNPKLSSSSDNLTTSGINSNLYKLNYSSYMAIQGGYFIAIPKLLDINAKIDSYLININEENLQGILVLFISFSSVFIFLALLFITFLCLINVEMQQGLEKVSLIQTEKINETINKITDFKERVLNKFVKLDFMVSGVGGRKNLDKQKSIGKKLIEKRKEKEKELATKLAESKYAFDENRQIKNLNVLNSSFYKALFIVGILAAILIPVFLQCKLLINNSNRILVYKKFIIKDIMSTNLNILNIKCKISSCEKSQFINRDISSDFNLNYNYSYIQDPSADQEMNSITNEFPEIHDFYESKYLLDVCETISQINEITYDFNSESAKALIISKCKNDKIIVSANQTVSLMALIKDAIFNLDKNIILLKNTNDRLEEFSNQNFKDIEYIYYNYLSKVYPNLEYYVELSLYNFSYKIEIFIVTFMILFSLLILIFAIYIYFVYIKTLIHMLSISRCVLRVIPTNVIFDTPKLEAWIESKF